ncbi:hypothetical protein [Amycolatopsis aidingensis]|uniref:hypothetical protein n=1 Tax=Amycolatopsis aidingensis TaxID=2842453 RepID=UPI001E52051F|nr:hypothetical protein [Amycolatopsis aidingensis]
MRIGKRVFAVLAAATMTVLGMQTPAAASAQDEPTIRQLLDQCERGVPNVCVFHPTSSPQVYRGEYQLAGGARNCSAGNTTRVIRWESSATTTNSVGVTISASVRLGEIFEAGFETSFTQEWSWSSTRADEVRHELGPYQAVDIFAAPMRQRIVGTYEMHFEDRYYGHYYWYVHNVAVDGPAAQPAWDIYVQETDPHC